MEKTLPSKQLVQFESFGKFLQDVWLVAFLLIFAHNEAVIPIPFLWVLMLFLIGVGVTILFRRTGYQIAVAVVVAGVIGGTVFLFNAPFWLFFVITAFAIWRIQERFAKVQEDVTHDGVFFILLVVFFAFAYFLATVLNNKEAIQDSLILVVLGLLLFVLDRMIVQWLRSKGDNQVPFSKLLVSYITIMGIASITFGLLAGLGSKAREVFVSLFGNFLQVLFYPFGLLIEWLRNIFVAKIRPLEPRESQSKGEMEYKESEKVVNEVYTATMDIPWIAVISILSIIVIAIVVWRLSKHKIEPVEIVQDIAHYERSQMESAPIKTGQALAWSYSMDTNIVRDAYRDFENEAGQIGFSRKPNETIREWFKRQEWIVTEHFYEVYDIVRYSGELMDDQDGQWFIQELNNLSEKYFKEEV
ncbi:hypothetical protein [Paenisporosarcina indica]|uniref:hypothetical protein n=1 Tax=Paenisporosarcina indica TaxID=650093 RepID=UPI00094FDC24|nr:hypothetical protein [Paenisporosarcina indica]